MHRINTQNHRLSQVIDKILNIILDNGGYINPELIIRESNGNITVHSSGRIKPGQDVLSVPITCIPYIEQFSYSISDRRILVSVRQDIEQAEFIPSKTQIMLMQEIVETFNLTGKLQWFKTVSPIMEFGGREDFASLLSAREPDLIAYCNNVNDINKMLNIFLQSRVFTDTRNGMRWLLPGIDLVDHHSFADAFKLSKNNNSADCLTLTFNRVDGNNCYASYSLMDAFHSWVRYAFVDDSAFFIQSVPFLVDLGRGRFVKIRSLPVNSFQLDPALWSAKDNNSYFYAAQFSVNKNELDVSFILIPPKRHVKALLEVIGMYLEYYEYSLGTDKGEIHNKENLKTVVEELIKANVVFYKKLQLCVSEPKPAPSHRVLADRMLNKQFALLKQFAKSISHIFKLKQKG